jgi:predicted secreted Zn-dependent protease
LVPVLSHGEPVASAKTIYYDVQGETPREIRRAINANRPIDPGGGRHDGLTRWNITWTYSWRQADGRFFVEKPQVTVTLVTNLPKWLMPERPDPAVVARWQAYIKALVAHEKAHAAFAIQGGKDLEQRLAKLPSQRSLEELKKLVDETGEQVLAEGRRKDLQYDAETEHGSKEGARFP